MKLKILKVAVGQAADPSSPYRHCLVTDGQIANYYDLVGTMYWVPQTLADELSQVDSQPMEEFLPVMQEQQAKQGPSVTDLLALKTTFTTEDIVKLSKKGLV